MISGVTTLWLLVFSAGHSYAYVPGIATEQECERLYAELKRTGWERSNTAWNETHRCIPYQSVVR